MVHSGYHPLNAWMVHIGSSLRSSEDNAWMVHSGYHPLEHRPLRIMLGWCTVDIILLSIVLLG